MERDFMGLHPKPSPVTVKQEVDDGSSNSAAMRGSGLQWSFANTAAASQILSFKSGQERKASHELYPPSFSQRNLPLDKQGGSRYPISSHQWQHNDAHSVNHPPDTRTSPVNQSNQMVPATVSSILPSHLVSNRPNTVGSSVPPHCPVVGSTDLRSSSSLCTGPCQLTIFYNGSVCVYDNVSPEKAQAIMLLAGNGDSTISGGSAAAVPSTTKLQPLVLKPPAHDSNLPKQSVGFSSSISLPPPLTPLPAVAYNSPADVTPVKPAVAPVPIKCSEPRKSSARITAGGLNFISSAVPQARKASLARFLEKRKDRVTSASPYVVSKNSSECSAAGPGESTLAT